jgi:hypothetical protein
MPPGRQHSCRRMRTDSEDREVAGNEHFSDNLPFLATLKVGTGMDTVLSRPASRSKQRVETVRIRSLVSVGNDLSANDFGTELLRRTGNMALVMRVMGQKTIKAAMAYQHPELDQVRSVLNERNNGPNKQPSVA